MPLLHAAHEHAVQLIGCDAPFPGQAEGRTFTGGALSGQLQTPTVICCIVGQPDATETVKRQDGLEGALFLECWPQLFFVQA
jgi:hypothetical protein